MTKRELYNRMLAILDTAKRENRALTASESAEFERLETDFDQMTEMDNRRDVRLLPGMEYGSGFVIGDEPRADILKPEQRFADLAPNTERLSIGKYVRGILTGEWRGADAERSMSVGMGSAGGYVVPTPLSAQVIDLARNKSRVLQAGAMTVPMESATLKMARVAGDPTASWIAENGTITPSDITLEQIELEAQALVTIVKASRQVVEDGGDRLDAVVSNAIASALALELDRVALYGTGLGAEPLGLMNDPDLSTVSLGDNGAAITNYSKFITAITQVWNANHEPTAYLMAPRTAGTIAGFVDTTGQPLQAPDAVAALKPFVTKQIPVNRTQGSANTASDIILGDFSQMLIGMRKELVIELLRERYSDTLTYGFLAYLRADTRVAHPEAFAPIIGILAA